MVSESETHLIRERESVSQLLASERLLPWFMNLTVDISSLHRFYLSTFVLRSAIDVMRIAMTFITQSQIATTFSQHRTIFFYKSVAIFFERRLELAHQAPQSCFWKTKQVTCSNVKRCIGSAETIAVCTCSNLNKLVRRWLWQQRKKPRKKQPRRNKGCSLSGSWAPPAPVISFL